MESPGRLCFRTFAARPVIQCRYRYKLCIFAVVSATVSTQEPPPPPIPHPPATETPRLSRRDLIVVGAGVIGMEYACMINVVPGTSVTVVDSRPNVLSFADNDVIENLQYSMRQNGALAENEKKCNAVPHPCNVNQVYNTRYLCCSEHKEKGIRKDEYRPLK